MSYFQLLLLVLLALVPAGCITYRCPEDSLKIEPGNRVVRLGVVKVELTTPPSDAAVAPGLAKAFRAAFDKRVKDFERKGPERTPQVFDVELHGGSATAKTKLLEAVVILPAHGHLRMSIEYPGGTQAAELATLLGTAVATQIGIKSNRLPEAGSGGLSLGGLLIGILLETATGGNLGIDGDDGLEIKKPLLHGKSWK